MRIEVESYLPKCAASLGHDLHLPFCIVNASTDDDATLKKGSRLVLENNGYWVESSVRLARDVSPDGGRCRVVIVARVIGHKTASDIRTDIRLSLRDANGQRIQLAHGRDWSLPMWAFCGDLLMCKPPSLRSTASTALAGNFINLLMYGVAGAGKSAFVNSFLTLLHRSLNLVQKAEVGGVERHNTRSLTRYAPIFDDASSSARDQCKLRLWDVWGVTADTHQNAGDVADLISGVLPRNWQMDKVYDTERRALETSTAIKSRPDRRAHCVLFFMPAGSLDNADECELVRAAFMRAHRVCPNPLVLVTMLDDHVPDLRADPAAHANSAAVRDVLQRAADTLQVPRNRVHAVINYKDEESKAVELERQLLRVALLAVRTAKDNYAMHRAVDRDNQSTLVADAEEVLD